MTSKELTTGLGSILRAEQISITEDIRAEHSTDKWHAAALPDVVVFAESTEDVAAVLRFASTHKIPVYTRAAGTGHIGGCVPVNGGILISVMRMNRILEINPSDGVCVTQPGVITGELQDAVREHGWYYPPDPASLKECSIGGNIATNAGGPRCLKYGVTKQYVLGLTVVLANGEILKTGGRCHKNSTGFDLTSLMVGSEGMLGIVTEITVRLIPHPQTRAMLGASFPDFTAAAAAVQAILDSGTLPSALEITDGFTMAAWQTDQQAQQLQFVPDGNGSFTEAMGMMVDKSELGLGKRSWRYSMLVVDGVIEKQFIEPDVPGDPFQVSDADTMLAHLNADAEQPKRVSILTKAGCPHCVRAKALLTTQGLPYEEIELGSKGISYSSLAAITGRGTAPQIFIDGEHIGGADELEQWVAG